MWIAGARHARRRWVSLAAERGVSRRGQWEARGGRRRKYVLIALTKGPFSCMPPYFTWILMIRIKGTGACKKIAPSSLAAKITSSTHLVLWIAEHCRIAPLPANWVECFTADGDSYFHNTQHKSTVRTLYATTAAATPPPPHSHPPTHPPLANRGTTPHVAQSFEIYINLPRPL
jgi:hypothetical protein